MIFFLCWSVCCLLSRGFKNNGTNAKINTSSYNLVSNDKGNVQARIVVKPSSLPPFFVFVLLPCIQLSKDGLHYHIILVTPLSQNEHQGLNIVKVGKALILSFFYTRSFSCSWNMVSSAKSKLLIRLLTRY